MRAFKAICTLFLALLATSDTALASILAIDYGTEWTKASLMKPGMPFDVLLNRDSKRKMQSTVGWKSDERLFGGAAFNLASRFPKDSFSSLKGLQGQTSDADAVSFYTSISTTEVVDTARKTIALRRSDSTEWSVEELIGMQFAYVRELAESTASERITDVVVTVPPYFSQFERQAVVDAIEIAGMRPLSLLNDGTAVAINYAMTRNFPTPETHIIYDAGAGSIRATVVTFSSVAPESKSKSKSKGNSTIVEVKAIGYVRGIGGNEMDKRLREILINDFIAKHNKDIRKDPRAIAKLWKEAGRVKSALSLNSEAVANVESLAFDIDFKTKVSRAAFEEALADVKPAFTQPIMDALKNAGLTMKDISSVILMGGSSRTPIIQQAVKSLVGEDKIAQNVNTDEAAVLGAAFYGASISSQFKTKDIKVQDINLYDIQVSYPAESKTSGANPRIISSLIFPIGSKYGSKKTLTFKRHDDFPLTLSYKSPQKGVFPSEISQFRIEGVAEALGNLTERGAIEPVIKVNVVLTESGFAIVQDAVAHGEIKDDSIAGKLKGFFGGSSSSSEESSTETSTTETSTAATPSASADKKDTKDKDLGTIKLKIDGSPLSIHPLTHDEKWSSRDRLLAIDQAERAKARREEARNVLEASLYRLRDLLDGDADSTFISYSKEEERKKLSNLLDDSFHWLSEFGDTAQTKEIHSKREALEAIEQPIQLRHQEGQTRGSAIANFEQALLAGKAFIESAYQNYTIETESGAANKYTLEELDEVDARIKDLRSWLDEKLAKQKTLAKNDDPALLTSELEGKGMAFQQHVMRLLRRKIPKKPVTSTTESASSSTVTESATTSTAEPTQDGHDEL
ncbi:hypothetical protein M422DRAFT_249147 [Sphaerobolus stellatus SS14]|nr:hypothetical protein M422DRAFT_249147 [Sphaerobolus stellatus SS14]